MSSRHRIEPEFHSKPEKARHGSYDACHRSAALMNVVNPVDHVRCSMCALTKTNQGFGKSRIGVHRNVPGDIVKNVGFRQLLQSF